LRRAQHGEWEISKYKAIIETEFIVRLFEEKLKMTDSVSISRRDFMIGAAASMLMSPQVAQTHQKKMPNIVLIIADDASLGDFGCYGHPHIKTPNVDQLAIDGVRFRHAFVTSPQCSPSRTSIWTGKYAHSMGTEDLHTPLPRGQIIVSELLRQKGYYCGNAGKFHLGKNAEQMLDFLDNDIKTWRKFMDIRPKDKPFFLVQGFYDPHRPYEKVLSIRPISEKML
jgi:hypothetical protein